MSTDNPGDLRYTRDHEWVRAAAGEATVGITAFAVEQLGDVTLVDLDVKVGDDVTAGKPFGTIESVKTLSDLYVPVTGRVLRVNGELAQKPELVNEDCYGKAWMIVIAPSDAKTIDRLMDSAAYGEHVKASTH
ncbi:MAG: glycine cleavage system protein GcvH [Polyangiaceae bacterium]|jgi:glycine cleavage system H protein